MWNALGLPLIIKQMIQFRHTYLKFCHKKMSWMAMQHDVKGKCTCMMKIPVLRIWYTKLNDKIVVSWTINLN